MKIIGIIPARYGSSRFPGKPLVDIDGKSMIQRVYEQASKSSRLDAVIVATDDVLIADEVSSFGGRFHLTSAAHQSGTDRCAEVILKETGYDVVINIQGDEPYIDPQQIDLLISCFDASTAQLATLVKKIVSDEELFNSNIPKVILNASKEAVYFSRQAIPFIRGKEKDFWLAEHQFYKHIGIYGYTAPTLLEITKLQPSLLELAESLEQLRWVENGYTIQTRTTDIETIAVDAPEDLIKLKSLY
ncbi:3-deoxy-manno-octulosonate cytidylyltransferase [Pedobacter quisquiliarum]|uniref:3-deoxy-manno-octulosonate cytidylyltransferase n=1 Tax=Pedobacter quisquiliarum TaxID=1834438 RepID=A0A916U590_9SPHI|nr:3-deoxy-manno-octulosonate cytidylyltransferase [Pedobacter quisquiliarum]GGC60673.1 3-deoxy-manno-octulosonate cytidylyltransferase [Pedobacter quisquiliarum]